MTAYPLILTVEHEDGEWSEDYGYQPEGGYAIIKLNGRHEVAKIELKYFSDQEDLEQVAAGWFASLRTAEERVARHHHRLLPAAGIIAGRDTRGGAVMAKLTVEQADRLAQERPPYPPPSDVPSEQCPGPTKWHRPRPEDWNRGNRESACTWCRAPIERNFADPIWREADGTAGETT